jgi:tetratricopeptide (TPR) repeat protein
VPAVPPPAPVAGAPSDSRPLPWRALYQQAWNRLGGDPEGAAAAIEALIDSAPTAADAEDAMVALASIYHDNLGQFTRARAVYERYLKRFPAGTYRRDVWMRLCLAYGETGDAEKQRLCLQAFAADR